jgi:hypothetical protein
MVRTEEKDSLLMITGSLLCSLIEMEMQEKEKETSLC